MTFMTACIWHLAFLVGMGFVTSAQIFIKIGSLDESNAGDVPINLGFQLFAFGALYGVVDYLSGIALTTNHGYIMDMISFDATYFTKTTSYSTVYNDAGGETTTTATIIKHFQRYKDFLALDEILSYWPDLFWALNLLQATLPYFYIMMLEATVGVVFLLTLFMY